MKLAKKLGAITLASAMVMTSVPVVTMANEVSLPIEVEEVALEEATEEVVEEVTAEDAEEVMVMAVDQSEDTTDVKIAKSALALTLEDAKDCDSSNYTDAVITALDSAITAAEAEVNKTKVAVDGTYKYVKTTGDTVTYYDLDTDFESALKTLKTKLDEAVEGLANGDLTTLVNAITAAKAVDKNSYDMTAVQTAVEAAEAALLEIKEGTTAYSELGGKVSTLEAAVEAAKKEDTDLKEKVKEAEAIKADNYTAASFKALQTAIANAKAVLNAETFDASEAGKQLTALTKAMTEGTGLVSISTFAETVKDASELVKADYTRHSWDAFEVALYEANKVMENAQDADQVLAQDDITTADGKLAGAVDALVNIAELKETYNTIVALNLVNPGAEADADETLKTYTDSSWEAYTEALEEAKTLLDDAKVASNDTIDQDAVDAAKDALQEAVYGSEDNGTDGLVAISELIALIEESTTLTEKDYTTGTWSAYTSAVSTAKTAIRTTVYGDVEATKSEVADQVELVKTAKANLSQVTKGALRKAITDAKAVVEHKDYYVAGEDTTLPTDGAYVEVTEDVWEAFTAQITAAETIAASEIATSETIESAIDSLKAKMSAVTNNPLTLDEIKALNTTLGTVKAKEYAEENYTVSTWKALANALAKAEELSAEKYPAKAALASANQALTSADSAVVLVTKANFLALIKEAKTFGAEDYTTESFEALTAEIEKAEAFYKSLPITLTAETKATTKVAYNTLEVALNGLAAKDVDTTALAGLVEEVKDFSEFGFTADADFATFEAALEAAQDVLEDSRALQPAIEEAYNNLKEAVEALEGKEVNVATLKVIIASVDKLQETDYAVLAWSAVTTAVNEARTAIEESDSDVSEAIRTAQTTLKEKIDALATTENAYVKSATAVKAVVALATAKEEKAHTVSSWAVVAEKLAALKTLVYNEAGSDVDASKLAKVTNSALRNAEKELNDAVNALVVANEAATKAALAAAKEVVEADYTAESYAVLAEAMTYAEEVILEGGPASEYRASENAIVEAIKGLVEAEAKEEVKTPESFVSDLFESVMGRPATDSDISFFVEAIKSGEWTGAQLVHHFTTEDEFLIKNLSDEEFIQAIYTMGFGREADESGLAYWTADLATSNRTIVMAKMLTFQEFNDYCSEIGITTGKVTVEPAELINFIERLYVACIGREGTTLEVLTWAPKLINKEMTGSGIAGFFMQSPEFVNRNTTNAEYVEALYKAFFGNVDPEGQAFWLQQIEEGAYDRQSALEFFAGSEQFAGICEAAGIER